LSGRASSWTADAGGDVVRRVFGGTVDFGRWCCLMVSAANGIRFKTSSNLIENPADSQRISAFGERIKPEKRNRRNNPRRPLKISEREAARNINR
jgi:hypothetical protein